MPGVVETLAAETRDQRRKEAARVSAQDREAAARREIEEREYTAEARVLAMQAAQAMTGRVIFPARWEIVPLEDNYRRCLRETIEGAFTIWVYVKSGYVSAVLVSANPDRKGECVRWENPMRRDVPPIRWPKGPGRDWLRRALIDLGVI